MYCRQYSDSAATLKEWAKQLNVVNEGNYPVYSTVEKTLDHWRIILNQNIGTNSFGIQSSNEQTISNWQDKLNIIYNK